MTANHNNRTIEIAAILISLTALGVSLFSIQYSKQSAHSAVAQIRPQLEIYCNGMKLKGDYVIGTLSIQNIGQTTAMISELRLIVDDSGVYYPYFKGAIIYKNGLRVANLTIPTVVEYGGKKYNFLDQIKKDGGLQFENHYKCMEMQDMEFSDTIVSCWAPDK